MVKGIVLEGCTDVVIEKNTFINLDVGVECRNTTNIEFKENKILNDEDIKNNLAELHEKYKSEFPKNIPLEYIRPFIIYKDDNSEKNLIKWLSSQGFNVAFVVSTLLSTFK